MTHEIKDYTDRRADKITKFMRELSRLLSEHRTTIIRSATTKGELVVCTHLSGYDFVEFVFAEDIDEEMIANEYFKEREDITRNQKRKPIPIIPF